MDGSRLRKNRGKTSSLYPLIMTNNATNDNYPKTLLIRNEVGGMIWQVYHVDKLSVANRLADNAHRNGFYGISLEDYDPTHEETFPGWQSECSEEFLL